MTSSKILKNRRNVEAYVKTKRGHVGKLLANAKVRAKKKKLDFVAFVTTLLKTSYAEYVPTLGEMVLRFV
jgi:rRNA pseudouridine-1189 N-methylase Emg1 (Nep1/Mra1 family)